MKRSLLALLLAAACGDNASGDHPGTAAADAAASASDATAGDIDATETTTDAAGSDAAPNTAIVFDNSDGTFVWEYWCDCLDIVDGNRLDITRAAADQDGTPARSSIDFFKRDPSIGNITAGGFWFRSWHDRDAPGMGARFAIGERFIIEGSYPDETWDDLEIKPPKVLAPGDSVGPEREWLSGEPPLTLYDAVGPQEAHFRDLDGDTGPDQIWFMDGIVGVSFVADDGTHYGFVELAFEPGQANEWQSLYRPLRWGYQPAPDTPLVIPP